MQEDGPSEQIITLHKVDQSIHQASPHRNKAIYVVDGDESDQIYVLVPLCKAKIKRTGLYCTRAVHDATKSFCNGHTPS